MSDPTDSRPIAKVISLAGRTPRRAPKPAPPAPPAGEYDDDASLLEDLEAQGLDEAIAGAERDVARGVDVDADVLAELHNRRALRSFLRGDHAAAIAAWQAVIDEDPRRTNALELRAIYLAEIGDLAGARADLDHLIRLSPKSADAYRSRALFFHCHDDFARARVDYERAASLAPGNHEIYVLLAAASTQAHDFPAAVRALGRAIKLMPWSADLHAARAKELTLAGRRDEALRDLARCLELDPRHAEALRWRASLHPFPEGVDARLADLDRALAVEPDRWEALRDRAACHQHRGEHGLCVADLTRAITLFFAQDDQDHDEDAALHAARADAHLSLGAADDAVEDLKRVIALQEGWVADTHLLLADAHRLRGDLPAAAAAYREAILRDPSQRGALRERLQENRDAGRTEAQREDLEILLLLYPTDTDALEARAQLFSEAGAHAEALADLDGALAGVQATYRHDLFHQRAGVRWSLDDFAGALEDESRAIAIAPYEAEYHAWRGFLRGLDAGPSAEAEADVDRAVALAPEDLTAHYLRGSYLVLARRRKEALAAFTRRIALCPEVGILHFQRGEARLELGRDRRSRLRALADFDAAIALGYHDPEALEARARLAALMGVAAP